MLLITGGGVTAQPRCRRGSHPCTPSWLLSPLPPALHCIPVLPVWSNPQHQRRARCGGSVGVTGQVCRCTHSQRVGTAGPGAPLVPVPSPCRRGRARKHPQLPGLPAHPWALRTPTVPALPRPRGAGHTPAQACTSSLARPALAHPTNPPGLPAAPARTPEPANTRVSPGCAPCASTPRPPRPWDPRGRLQPLTVGGTSRTPSPAAPRNPSGCTQRWLRARDGAGAAVPDAGWATLLLPRVPGTGWEHGVCRSGVPRGGEPRPPRGAADGSPHHPAVGHPPRRGHPWVPSGCPRGCRGLLKG